MVSHKIWKLRDDLKIVFNLWNKSLNVFVKLISQVKFLKKSKMPLVLEFLNCGLPWPASENF